MQERNKNFSSHNEWVEWVYNKRNILSSTEYNLMMIMKKKKKKLYGNVNGEDVGL